MTAPGDRLELARGLLEAPTAPLLEAAPLAHLRAVLATLDGVAAEADAAGNLLARWRGPQAEGPPLVLVAHLDHPGFAVTSVTGRDLTLEFRGGLPAAHAGSGTPLRLFTAAGDEAGAATLTHAEAGPTGRLTGARARLDEGAAPEGGFAMWGFPGWVLEWDGDLELIVSRACDDLLGAAAALCTLAEVAASRPPAADLQVLFTRGEELGFLGALEAIRLGTVARDATVVSLECSKALADSPQGGGVIVRVGDRSSIFDPGLTEALRAAAERVAATSGGPGGRPGFAYRRKLMDGGSCEATAFCAAGYRASGLALPLGNYHNGGFGPTGDPTVEPESVAVSDFHAEVDLLVALASDPDLLTEPGGPPDWLAERAAAAREALGADRAG